MTRIIRRAAIGVFAVAAVAFAVAGVVALAR